VKLLFCLLNDERRKPSIPKVIATGIEADRYVWVKVTEAR
jgi:hypothetical protein